MAKRQTIIPQYGTVMKKGVLYYRTRIKDANGKLIALYAKTPEELYKRETIALEQIENATFHRKTPTVAEYCEKWLLMQSVHVRATTLTDYTSKVRRHIIAELGDKRMGEVSLDDIQLALVPVSKKSVSVYKSVVILYKSIFRSAMESRIIDHNPTIHLTTKGGGVPQEDRQALTDEQVERLLDAIRGLPPYVFVMIGLYAGLRREEILALQWDSVYLDTDIIWNSTTLECDRKFRNFWGSTRAVHRLSDTICIENGYSIVEAPKRRGQSYNKWLGDAAKPSHKEQLRQSIDRALAQKPASLEELLHLLEQEGFTVHRRGKTISVSAEGWGNNVRFDRLGDGYTLDDLLAVLSGQKVHTPRKLTAVQAAPPKVNLLVDIQDKLKAGKGAGYARWAKVFNLKQMAQTLNYLSEHGLLDYTDLETKTAEATARYNALSDQIKAAEKRMAEIAVLRTHIIN